MNAPLAVPQPGSIDPLPVARLKIIEDPSRIELRHISGREAVELGIGNGRLRYKDGRWQMLISSIHDDIIEYVKRAYALFEMVDETFDEIVALPDSIEDLGMRRRFLIAMIEDLKATENIYGEAKRYADSLVMEYEILLDTLEGIDERITSTRKETFDAAE